MLFYKYGELTNELKNKLSSLGLSSYEISAYIALLKSGTLSASELVKRTGIPHSRVYDISRRLSEKGLIEIVDGKPRKFKLIDPDIALRAFVEREKNKLKKICDDALNLIKLVTLSSGLEEKTTWVVEAKFIEIIPPLIEKTEYQLLLAAPAILINKLKEKLGMAASKGVNITTVIYGDSELKRYFVEKEIELYIRKASSLNIALIDSSTGVLSDPHVNYSILTTEPIFVRALMDLFYSSLVNTSTLVYRPAILRGKFASIWSIIHKLQKGEKLRVKGFEVKTGREVVVEGVVKNKVIDNGIASIILQTNNRVVKVGGIGAMLEDIEGLVFEIIS